MNIWKIIVICGMGAALILIGSAIGAASYAEGMLSVIAGVGVANLAMLAIVIDKLSKKD